MAQIEREKNIKALKDWVAANPEKIGIKDVEYKKIEYEFKSGDCVDILFKHKDGRYSVVEIETINPNPGRYQVLKYKVLKCAEIEEKIDSDLVEQILVAYKIDDETKNFCNKYGIRYFEIKPKF